MNLDIYSKPNINSISLPGKQTYYSDQSSTHTEYIKCSAPTIHSQLSQLTTLAMVGSVLVLLVIFSHSLAMQMDDRSDISAINIKTSDMRIVLHGICDFQCMFQKSQIKMCAFNIYSSSLKVKLCTHTNLQFIDSNTKYMGF